MHRKLSDELSGTLFYNVNNNKQQLTCLSASCVLPVIMSFNAVKLLHYYFQLNPEEADVSRAANAWYRQALSGILLFTCLDFFFFCEYF